MSIKPDWIVYNEVFGMAVNRGGRTAKNINIRKGVGDRTEP